MVKQPSKIDDVINAYLKKGNDFGFSSIDDQTQIIKQKESAENQYQKEIDQLKSDLQKIEEMIVPLLVNLLKTADKPNIHWPNRQEQIKPILEKLISITRQEQ